MLLRDDGWSLEDPRVQALLEKIRSTGVPLRDHVGSEIYRGVLTGCNEAFYIDEEVRRFLITKDPASIDLIKPQLRGQDISRWRPSSGGNYVIFVRRGTKIAQYPAVLAHLRQFEKLLEPRPHDWDEKRQGKWPGRKPGPYEWFEIQDSTAYFPLFEKPKIVVQCIGYHSRWAIDEKGFYVNNKTFFLPADDHVLLAYLNSQLMWWYMWRVFPHMKDEALSIDGQCVEQLPVARAAEPTTESIRKAVGKLLRLVQKGFDLDSDVAGDLARLTGVMVESKTISQWLPLTPEDFANRLGKIQGKRPAPALLAEAAEVHQKARTRQIELLTSQLELEKHLAVLVEDAYGLTPDERVLLRGSLPVRDPIDVLQARTLGQASEEEMVESE